MGLNYQMERYVCIASNQWILKISLTERQIPVFADLICHVKISVEIENNKKTLAKY